MTRLRYEGQDTTCTGCGAELREVPIGSMTYRSCDTLGCWGNLRTRIQVPHYTTAPTVTEKPRRGAEVHARLGRHVWRSEGMWAWLIGLLVFLVIVQTIASMLGFAEWLVADTLRSIT